MSNSLSLFVDTVRTKYFPNTGDPNAGTYRYKIQVRDTCGNYSGLSPYHNTIFMTNNSGNFSWPQLYSIENGPNPVGAYVLMRDDSSNGNWHAVNSVSGTQQSVTDPAYAAWQSVANWRIETSWSISCSPSVKNPYVFSTFNSSKSNTLKIVTSSVYDVSSNSVIHIYPNPTSDLFSIQSSVKISEVAIMNIFGEKIYASMVDSRQETIDISSQPSGIYFLQIQTSEGVINRKIVLAK